MPMVITDDARAVWDTRTSLVVRTRANRGEYACVYCGTHYGFSSHPSINSPLYPACEIVACLACEIPQCHGNGFRNGECSFCSGLLPGWSGWNRPCSRVGCDKQAVIVWRKRNVCYTHAGDVIKERIASVRAEYAALRELLAAVPV